MIASLLNGPLAQLVEQWTFNPLVVGSNPTRPTIIHIILTLKTSLPTGSFANRRL